MYIKNRCEMLSFKGCCLRSPLCSCRDTTESSVKATNGSELYLHHDNDTR